MKFEFYNLNIEITPMTIYKIMVDKKDIGYPKYVLLDQTVLLGTLTG